MSIQTDMANKTSGDMHWGTILKKSGGIGALTEGYKLYGFTSISGAGKAAGYDFSNDPTGNYVGASSLLAASFYLIIEGINQFTDEMTNVFINADNENFESHNGKLCCLGIFQLLYSAAACYAWVIAMTVVYSEGVDNMSFDAADNMFFANALMFDVIINIYESIMIMCCKRCCVKTICDIGDCCDCCTGSCAYCCVRGGGIEEISKRNCCYGCCTSSIIPMLKMFYAIAAMAIVGPGNWGNNEQRASQAAFVASIGYVLSDGINAFTDQLIEGNIQNENGCCLNIAGIFQIIYTSVMFYFMSEAYTASQISDNGYDKHSGSMLCIAFAIDICVNICEIFLIFCCRKNVYRNNSV